MTDRCTPLTARGPQTQVMSWATGDASESPATVGSDDESALADLRWHWGAAYEISIAENMWTARRRTGASLPPADSAGELLHLMRADYAEGAAPRSGEADKCEQPEPGPGERALRRLLDDGII